MSSIAKRMHDGATLTVGGLRPDQQHQDCGRQALDLDNPIDVTTGTVKLRAQFDNMDGALFPNQFVNISAAGRIRSTIRSSCRTRRCVAARPMACTSTFVYLVNTDRTVTVRPVTLGVVDGERVAVASGLEGRRNRGHRRRRPLARRRRGATAGSRAGPPRHPAPRQPANRGAGQPAAPGTARRRLGQRAAAVPAMRLAAAAGAP